MKRIDPMVLFVCVQAVGELGILMNKKSWQMCQLGDDPDEGCFSRGIKFEKSNPWAYDFLPKFVGGKNFNCFSSLPL